MIMAHNVEMIDGVAQMAYAGEVPWHGLGTAVSNDLTPQQIQEKAGLDWTVDKEVMVTGSGATLKVRKPLFVHQTTKFLMSLVTTGILFRTKKHSTSSLSMFLLVIWRCIQQVHSKVVRWSGHLRK
jgi:hypothetical protein